MGLAVVSLMLVVGAHAQHGGIMLPGSPTLYIPSLWFPSDAKGSSGGALLPIAPVGGLSGGAPLPSAPVGGLSSGLSGGAPLPSASVGGLSSGLSGGAPLPSATVGGLSSGLSGGALLPNAPVGGRFAQAPFLPLSPVSVFSSQGRISSGGFRNIGLASTSTDPCRPTPCGPNTSCRTTSNGRAQCRCLDDFVPDGNTINGCKPQCTRDNDCPDDYLCQATKCVRVCQPGACGINADCDTRNHRAICECPRGYQGQPESRCTKIPPPVSDHAPQCPHCLIDVCQPNPCGQNAECRPRDRRPVCTCPIGYSGDPLTNCIRGECIENNDCPGHMNCQKLKCINPCDIRNICGRDAECQTRNHQPICSCGQRMVGDPFIACTPPFGPASLCLPSPCGRSTNCRVRNERAVCSCIDNYLGDPLTGCRPECVSESECPGNIACNNNRCVNPCINACGEGALCDVVQGRARCSCPEFYQGNPQNRCYPECTAHDDCPSHQACSQQLQCVDPCAGSCGVGAECKVENHTPICFCPKGYTGHPFESCRPFILDDLCRDNPCGLGADCTPGFDRDGNDRPVCTCPRGFIGNPIVSCQRGECERHTDCSNSQACYAYTCQNPCYTDLGSVCGDNAECTVKKNQPVCSCPPGYDGNPLQSCYPRSQRFTAGRAK